MTYIPVGTRLTYTCSFTSTFTTASAMIAKLKNDLPNLPGYEELDIETSEETTHVFAPNTFSITVLNNGVDHADEHDVQSIIDGTIQNYSTFYDPIHLVSSSITKIQQPNEPPEITGAGTNQPKEKDSGFSLSNLFSPSTGTKLLGTGALIIIAIIALILLLPGGFARAFRTVRG